MELWAKLGPSEEPDKLVINLCTKAPIAAVIPINCPGQCRRVQPHGRALLGREVLIKHGKLVQQCRIGGDLFEPLHSYRHGSGGPQAHETRAVLL